MANAEKIFFLNLFSPTKFQSIGKGNVGTETKFSRHMNVNEWTGAAVAALSLKAACFHVARSRRINRMANKTRR
jgi:hypothetical protein